MQELLNVVHAVNECAQRCVYTAVEVALRPKSNGPIHPINDNSLAVRTR